MKRYVLLMFVVLPVLLVLLPAALVFYFSPVDSVVLEKPPRASAATTDAPQPMIKVYRTEKKTIETVPLESYIEGVVSAEMPAEFELEALKAQALAARTYIIRRLKEGNFDDVPAGAHVLDTIKHQVYMDDQQCREKWGAQYEWKRARIHQAVRETAGVVLTYQGQPIDATFFSTSNGFTENADEYWNKPIPYLRSVASPWDRQSPRFEERTVMTASELEQKLGVILDAQSISNGSWYTVLERTTGNRISKIRIGNKEFTGKDIRERLGLNSSDFSMELLNGRVTITTHGYGHGVGMSQWGANGMAKAGKNAEQIVKYFYQGVSLENYHKIVRI